MPFLYSYLDLKKNLSIAVYREVQLSLFGFVLSADELRETGSQKAAAWKLLPLSILVSSLLHLLLLLCYCSVVILFSAHQPLVLGLFLK